MEFMDIFNDDAFGLVSLTALINNIDYVPSRVGELCFAGAGEGVSTLTVALEAFGTALSLVPTSPRGAPAPKEKQNKGTLRSVSIPQVKLEETISAHQIMGVRELGSPDILRGALSVVQRQMQKMTSRFDMTLEYHRMGAIRGQILDADGTTVLTDLFSLFGISAPADVPFHLDVATTDVRAICSGIIRQLKRTIKLAWPTGAKVTALAGDNFFDALVGHATIKAAYQNYVGAAQALGSTTAFQKFSWGGIDFENYQGTDDNSTVAIGTDECRIFVTGVPGLYAEYYAPADFFETVNTIGLPRYAKVAPDDRFNQYVELHTQMNPLPLCLRPQTLIKGKKFS
jgi:hypothetical protein